MYTIIVRDDNTLESTIRVPIIEKQNMVNEIHFLVNPTYQSGSTSFDMSEFTCTLEYLLPISKKYVTETLTASESLYSDMLEYILPVDTNLTDEKGDVKIQLKFTKTGDSTNYIRKTSDTLIKILPVYFSTGAEETDDLITDPVTMTIGDTPTFNIECNILNDDGIIVAYTPVEGDTFIFALRKSSSNTVVLKKELDTTTMSITFEEDDTKDLSAGKYLYEVSLNNSETGYHNTFIKNQPFILEDEIC